MIDLNNQLLGDQSWQVDLSTALAICRQSHRDGVEEVVVTLRMAKSAGTDDRRARKFEQNLRELDEQLSEDCAINLKLKSGYEWILDDNLPERLREFPGHPAINRGNYLLVSFPSLFIPDVYQRTIGQIIVDGYVPIISHPECNRVIRRNHSIIGDLIKLGCLIQIDAQSVIGGYTNEIELFTRELLERGQIHFIATRAGQQNRREASLNTAFECAGRIIGRGAARSLVEENPSAVIANGRMIKAHNRSSLIPVFETALDSRA
jgi:protein-tyrosine phosphatase